MIEIYDKNNILFVAPLSRQDEFYVEETEEEDKATSQDESEKEGVHWPFEWLFLSVMNTKVLCRWIDISEPVNEDLTRSAVGHDFVHPETNGPIDDSEESSGSSFEELQH